jgi:class 3 adenylate cyclase
VAQLLDKLQGAARDEGIGYLKFFSDQVIAAVDPNEGVDTALQRLAEFATRVKADCESLFAQHHAALDFRIGIDVGPAVGSVIGRDNPAFAFWGEAVRTAIRMAESSLPGAIHVTESAYQSLRERYVFQLRGHHYLEGLGEFSTYLLGGRL